MDRGFVDIVCLNCRKRLLHYYSRLFRADIVKCPRCEWSANADEMLDALGWKLHEINRERIINGNTFGKAEANKMITDAIFKFHPDRNPHGVDAHDVLVELNKLKELVK